MKGVLNIIRWKFVLPVGALIAAIVVFFVLFFDPIAERLVERVASRVNGAKVEIDGFKTKFFKGRLDIARLQVTDRENPMTNVVETANLAFQMNPAEVARMRFVINESTLSGLRFGTPRKTSGALPKLVKKQEKEGPPGPAAKLMNKYQGRFKVSLAGMANEAKRRIEFDPKQTVIVKRSEELQGKAKTLPDEWEKRVDNLKAEERLKQIGDDIESVKKTPTKGVEALTAIPESIKKLNKAKADLAQLKTDVTTTKETILGEVKTFRSNVLSLNDARKQDIDDLMSRLNLDFADPQRLMESVIGPMVVDRFRTVLGYVEIARRHMPSKKVKESVKEKPRAGGTNVEFPTPAAPPRFWLQKAALDGQFRDVAASGQMSDLTSNPARAGRPFKLALAGRQAAQSYSVNAVLDHVTDVARDSFVAKASGLDVAALSGSTTSLLVGGTAAAELAFNLVGDGGLGGGLALSMTGAKLDRATFLKSLDVPEGDNLSEGDKLKASFAGSLLQSLESMPQILVNAQLFGTWEDPSFKVTSNLTDAFTGVVKSSVGNFVKEQRAELEARLNTLVTQERAKLDAEAAKLEARMNDRIAKLQAEVDRKINEASGVNLSGGASPASGIKIPKLDKLFK